MKGQRDIRITGYRNIGDEERRAGEMGKKEEARGKSSLIFLRKMKEIKGD